MKVVDLIATYPNELEALYLALCSHSKERIISFQIPGLSVQERGEKKYPVYEVETHWPDKRCKSGFNSGQIAFKREMTMPYLSLGGSEVIQVFLRRRGWHIEWGHRGLGAIPPLEKCRGCHRIIECTLDGKQSQL